MTRSFSWSLALASLTLCSCHFARTDFILETLNKPAEKGEPGPSVTVTERVGRLTRDHLADAYLAPATVAGWMSELGRSPAPLVTLVDCLTHAAGADTGPCYQGFFDTATKSPWGLPEVPKTVEPAAPDAAEVDAARFLANAVSIAPSLAALQQAVGKPFGKEELEKGIQEGAEAAAQYIHARRWHRELQRPSTALVLSGGAANGAFSAGALWRLLGILEQCRGKATPEGCGDAGIDLVAGASTGSLIGTLIDLFHTPGQEHAARELLVSNYTCSVESDLYCVNSAWDWELVDDVRGLVRFDGIQNKLKAAVTPAMLTNHTELVSVSVDYATGDIQGISDQDPSDFPATASEAERVEGFIQAVMASIVEPVLAEPVDWVPSKSGRMRGTFVDGGVRSGLPLLQAVQRGAERVLVISTAGIDPERVANPPHAFGVLMRTLDLFVAQPRVGEVQQGEMAAVARRFTEYNLCMERLAGVASRANVTKFCTRTGAGFSPPALVGGVEVATSPWMGPARFEQVASSWRSAWMYRPEATLETASGYAFTPEVMRPLFLQGVSTFQARCQEILRLFEIRGTLAANECKRPAEEVLKQAEETFAPMRQCMANKPEQRKCR
ncbi:patatin-like phospholipase family protein [Archangium violaceum]|uniref:patatin-like phospholipase family protein n=1 Tax=Archangium violaceum TaxID=83451 RepID=UPI00195257F4|nr:patatin-like phospholipase family protein [Archangium violaceum]QRO02219.1 patatin-like phospholipase family protein [Archangium violaceum]